mgnify:CR=1 FL=1
MRNKRNVKHSGQAYVKSNPVKFFEWMAYSTTTGHYYAAPATAITTKRHRHHDYGFTA